MDRPLAPVRWPRRKPVNLERLDDEYHPRRAAIRAFHPNLIVGRKMRTQYYTAATLDGFIATEEDSLDWLFALGDPEGSSYPDFIRDIGAIAMGSATYEWLHRNFLKLDSETPGVWPYQQPTWIFSHRTLPPVPNADIRFASGDVRAVHESMRAAANGKNLWLAGGGGLVSQFHEAGLLDEIIVQVGSVVLGSGKKLLTKPMLPPSLKLTSVQRIGNGFAELRYDVVRSA